MAQGKVKFFNRDRGYGFIVRDDGECDVFVHQYDLPDGVTTLIDGETVTFNVEKTDRGIRARDLKLTLARIRSEFFLPLTVQTVDAGSIVIVDSQTAYIGSISNKEVAGAAVRAINAHDELVDALRDALKYVDSTPGSATVSKSIRAVLTRARGGEA